MTTTRTATTRDRYPPGWLVGRLPFGMQDDELLVRLTTIFERLGATLRDGADGVEHVVDPTVTSPAMLDYLTRWLGYDVLDDRLSVHRQRRIVAAVGASLPLRGTVSGLRMVLEAVTDGPVHVDEPGGVGDDESPLPDMTPVVVTVRSVGHFREHELAALVRDEVPAHLPVQLVVDADPEGSP